MPGAHQSWGTAASKFLVGYLPCYGSKNEEFETVKVETYHHELSSKECTMVISHALTYKIANMIRQESFAKGFGYKKYDMIVGN